MATFYGHHLDCGHSYFLGRAVINIGDAIHVFVICEECALPEDPAMP